MKLHEQLQVRWAWRRERGDEPPPYGYTLPREGVAPALVVTVAVVAIAAGGWLGTQSAGGGAGETAPLLGLEPAAATDARDAIDALSTARADGRRDLAAATSPPQQAAAALALRRAHLRAVTELAGNEAAMGGALRRTAAAYAALARAAEDHDRRAFARASTAIAAAERDLERLVGAIL